MKDRIICIGNRLVDHDRAGPAVYDRLAAQEIPSHIELIEGGISGLNLLAFLENAATVVFVDSVSGFTHPDGVVLLDQTRIKEACPPGHYGHDAGVAYLLAVLPGVCETPLPRNIFLVGLEGHCSQKTIDHAATLALSMIETR